MYSGGLVLLMFPNSTNHPTMDDANSAGSDAGLSREAINVLRTAGWDPESERSDVAEWIRVLESEFSPFPRALEVLTRFGGVDVKLSGPGEAWARQSFRFDPTRAEGEGDRFSDFSSMLGVRLYPLGEVGNEAFLAIAEDGRVYALMLDLWLVGASIENAIETMVRGRASPVVISEEQYRSWCESVGEADLGL
jgi:hypothetical protein